MARRLLTQSEIADAFGRTEDEFAMMLPRLQSIGFPSSLQSKPDCWELDSIVEWLLNQHNQNKALADLILSVITQAGH